jgi:hypothetical protein
MQCEKIREQFADYVTNQIEEPARSRLVDHLMACADCRAEAGDLMSLWTSLGSIPGSEPGPELRSRFQVMLQAYEQGLDRAPAGAWRQSANSWLTRWRRPALRLAGAVALLVLGVAIGRRANSVATVPEVQPNGEVAELRGELAQLRQMVALSLMQQQSASDRLRGVNWSYQLQQPGGEVLAALLDTLMHDPNVNVRLATIDALRQFGDQPAVRRGVVEALGRQESPMVQVALIDLAVDLREREFIPALRRLVQEQKADEAVRYRAQKGLAELE